jgi:glycosyltransferase involved in cell wall biosynthesis
VKSFFIGYNTLQKTWYKPDIIHVNVLTRLGILALYMRWFHQIGYVVTEHWSRYLPVTGTYKGIIRKFITKVVVRNASAISTVSVNLASAMQNHGLKNNHYLVLPNVVDTEAYTLADSKNNDNRIRFMHISCFEDRSKNISGILRTIRTLMETRNDFECLMVGEGVDFEKMKQLATNLEIKDFAIRFTGLLENEDLVSAYQSVCFTVMFSNYENMPVVISESFACGLPVIATAVGGIPEYVNQNTGILIPVGNENELLKALCFMLDHYNEFDKQKIRDSAVQNFSTSAVTQKLKELYGFVTN